MSMPDRCGVRTVERIIAAQVFIQTPVRLAERGDAAPTAPGLALRPASQ